MLRSRLRLLVLALALVASVGSCGDDPVGPVNHRPVVLSVSAFPSTIGPADSAIVICDARDPDADILVYDWITDDRLRIKGAVDGKHLFNTRANSIIVYHGPITDPVNDTAFVQCSARDQRGGTTSREAHVIVHQ